jgi:hypothetical protein
MKELIDRIAELLESFLPRPTSQPIPIRVDRPRRR